MAPIRKTSKINNSSVPGFVATQTGSSMKFVKSDIHEKEAELRAKKAQILQMRAILKRKQLQKQREIANFEKNKAKYCYCDWINIYGDDSEEAKAGFGFYAVANIGKKLVPLSLDPRSVDLGEVVMVSGQRYVRSKESVLINSGMDLSAPEYCHNFTVSGFCENVKRCRFIHSREHTALCRKFVSNKCTLNDSLCPLSHNPNEYNAPQCVFFSNGYCSKGVFCKFNHSKASDDAKICRPFALGGWCDRGKNCQYKHVYDCPDLFDYGACPKKRKCGLSHKKKRQVFKVDTSSSGKFESVFIGGDNEEEEEEDDDEEEGEEEEEEEEKQEKEQGKEREEEEKEENEASQHSDTEIEKNNDYVSIG